MRQTSKGRPGSRPSSQPAALIPSWVTTAASLARAARSGPPRGGPRTDEHGVGAVGQIDGERVHRRQPAASGPVTIVGSDGGEDVLGHLVGLEVVDVDDEVGHLLVEGRPLRAQPDHGLGRVVAEQRAAGAVAHAGGQRLGAGPQPHHRAARCDAGPVLRAEHGAAGHRDHRGQGVGAGPGQHRRLGLAEGGLAVAGEELGHGRARCRPPRRRPSRSSASRARRPAAGRSSSCRRPSSRPAGCGASPRGAADAVGIGRRFGLVADEVARG